MDKKKTNKLPDLEPLEKTKIKTFKCWATLSDVRAIKPTGCWQAKLQTQELEKELKDQFTDYSGHLGVFIFAETDISPNALKDIPKIKGKFKETVSTSQYLLKCMYVYYKKKYGEKLAKENFDEYRKTYLRKLASNFLSKAKDYDD